jgi:hypothetical protein
MAKRGIVPWMSGRKHATTSRGWGFSPFGDHGASTAPMLMRRPRAPRPLKNLEVMNDEITTTAAELQPQGT